MYVIQFDVVVCSICDVALVIVVFVVDDVGVVI